MLCKLFSVVQSSVSILVLVDFALKQWCLDRNTGTGGVSILVLVDFALKPSSACFCNRLFLVSILVLVDFALKLSIDPNLPQQPASFNPCFGGFCFKTQIPSGYLSRRGKCFNPCFGGFCFKTY